MKIERQGIYELVVSLLVGLSLGRIDHIFIPISLGGLTSNQLIFYLLALILAARSLAVYSSWPGGINFLTPLLFLSFWAVVSSFWSTGDLRGLAKGISYVVLTIAVLYIAMRCDVETFLRGAIKGTLLVLTICVLLSIALPHSAGTTLFHDGAWRGLFMQKNVLGRAATLGACFAFVGLLILPDQKSRRFALLLLSVSVLALVNSRSMTAIVVTIFFPIVFLIIFAARKSSLVSLVLCLLGLALVFFITPTLGLKLSGLLLEITDRSGDLTGRVPLWNYSISMATENLLVGYGVEGFWTEQRQSEYQSMYNFTPEHSHNGMLDLLLELGLVGVGLMGISLIIFVFSVLATKKRSRNITIMMIATISLLVSLNITESNLYRSSNTIFLLYMYIGLRCLVEMRIASMLEYSKLNAGKAYL